MNQAKLQGEYAGFLSRTAAFVTDVLIISLVVIIVNWFVPVMISQFSLMNLDTCATIVQRPLHYYTCRIIQISLFAFTISFPVLYTIFFWIIAGQTPGKFLFGLRIVRLNGHRMNLWVSLLRYLGYTLCILSLGLGFLNILINDRRQGWHDKLARTCVVYAWEARQNDELLDGIRYRLDRKRTKTT